MPVGTSNGDYYESDQDYWHANLFGQPQQQEEPKGENKLFLLRHGDTDLNEKGSEHAKDQPIRGWAPIQLNDDGIEQSHKAAEALKDKEVTRIVSSDLPRAKQTANILAKKLDVPVQFDSNLRTWDMGDYDGSADPAHREEVNKIVKEEPDKSPPGSSESFNQFKDRIINTMTGYAANNDGHNTVVVTHHSPERIFAAWEHAGYPENNSIHMPTYEETGTGPGKHMEVDMPESVVRNFGMRFEGQPQSLPIEAPGENFSDGFHAVSGTLRDDVVRPRFPNEMPFADAIFQKVPYDPDTSDNPFMNVMESPDDKLRGQIGPGPGRGEGGGSSIKWKDLKNDPKSMSGLSLDNKQKIQREGLDKVLSGEKEEPSIYDQFDPNYNRPSVGTDEDGGSLNTRGEPYTHPNKARFGNQNSVGNQGAKINLEPSRPTIEKLINEGKSDRAIADELNLNERLVSSRRKEWGFENNYQKSLWSPEKVDRLRQMDKEGKTPREIAKELNTTRNAIISKLNRLKE